MGKAYALSNFSQQSGGTLHVRFRVLRFPHSWKPTRRRASRSCRYTSRRAGLRACLLQAYGPACTFTGMLNAGLRALAGRLAGDARAQEAGHRSRERGGSGWRLRACHDVRHHHCFRDSHFRAGKASAMLIGSARYLEKNLAPSLFSAMLAQASSLPACCVTVLVCLPS